MKRFILLTFVSFCFYSSAQKRPFDAFVNEFCKGYSGLRIPEMAYDYTTYFATIPDSAQVKRQTDFFQTQYKQLNQFRKEKLDLGRRKQYDHIAYEIQFNLKRAELELDWLRNGKTESAGGISQLENHERWYGYFVQKFTSLTPSPENILNYGKAEVTRINHELDSLCRSLGFADRAALHTFLNDSIHAFYETTAIKKNFAATDSTIRSRLPAFVGNVDIPSVIPVEWPDAGEYTPPGIYLNHSDNLYDADVFMYNFYGGKFPKRAIEWLYLHEAIPGHHLQASLREQNRVSTLETLFSYPGNFEGWACYVEDCGEQLGMYTDPLSYVGKCEWDLVRSARLVLDVGIHYEGWSYDTAMEYWQSAIEGQDQLADREIQRVTNWPGQALSYKLGARFIREQFQHFLATKGSQFDQIRFYRTFLSFGMVPLPVIASFLEDSYHASVRF